MAIGFYANVGNTKNPGIFMPWSELFDNNGFYKQPRNHSAPALPKDTNQLAKQLYAPQDEIEEYPMEFIGLKFK